jgi:hypothetical protein
VVSLDGISSVGLMSGVRRQGFDGTISKALLGMCETALRFARILDAVRRGVLCTRLALAMGFNPFRWLRLEPGECSSTCSVCHFMTPLNHDVKNK